MRTSAVNLITEFAPAKLNLFLAVTGRREDGFHNLVSLAVTLDFGDTLRARASEGFALRCSDPAVPGGESNLVLRAARAFAAATGWEGGAAFELEKRIPTGAGLGGGSSDAVAALRALNRLAGPERALSKQKLAAVAAALGSDCPLFLETGPVVMRGRGERIEPLPAAAAERLRGRPVLVFKPGFEVSTPWAYGQLAAGAPSSYLPEEEAEAWLGAWRDDLRAPAEALRRNSFEAPVFRKFPALALCQESLRAEFALEAGLSGSGSACFAWWREGEDPAPVARAVRAAWGESTFFVSARVA